MKSQNKECELKLEKRKDNFQSRIEIVGTTASNKFSFGKIKLFSSFACL
jgi:hypothetical protein